MDIRDDCSRFLRCLLRLVVLTCLVPANFSRASEGSEIIDAVLQTCYEREVTGLTLLPTYPRPGDKSEPKVTFLGKDAGLQPTPPRQRIVPRTQSKYSMLPLEDLFFKDTRKLMEPVVPDGFEEVTQAITAEGPLLSLKELANPDDPKRVRIGDIVRLEPVNKKHPPLLLFYCGEQRLKGMTTTSLEDLGENVDGSKAKEPKASFFVYPYVDGVEWNTFPPRQHKDLREYILSHKGKKERSLWERIVAFSKSFFSSDPPEESALKYVWDDLRQVHWLKTPLSDNHCGVFHNDKSWSTERDDNEREYQFQVLRIKDNCKYRTLKHRFPTFSQGERETCWWCLYTQVNLYHKFAAHHQNLPPEVIQHYVMRRINEELVVPDAHETKVVTDWFREYAFERYSANPDGFKAITEAKARTLEGRNDPKWIKTMRSGKSPTVGLWPLCCENSPRWRAFGLESVRSPDVALQSSPDQMFQWLAEELHDDSPVIATIAIDYAKAAINEENPRWRGHIQIDWVAPTDQTTPQNIAGHAVAVIGLRQCGADKYVHFTSDWGFLGFTKLQTFWEFCIGVRGGGGMGPKFISDWKIGDKRIIEDEAKLQLLSPLVRVKK